MRTLMIMSILLLLFAVPSAAQMRGTSGYVMVGFGGQLSSGSEFTQQASVPFRFETATASTTYPVENGPLFDVGGGVLFGSFGVGVHLSGHAQDQIANMFADIPDPFRFDNNASDSADVPITRAEAGVHIQVTGAFRPTDKVQIQVFGGPSYISVAQDLVTDVNVLETSLPFPPVHEITIIGPSGIREVTEAAWGFNVGADVGFFFNDIVGIGAGVRFTRATVELPDLIAETAQLSRVTDTIAGGTHIHGGLRLRF